MEQIQNKHTIFGEIVEGLEVIDKINKLALNDDKRPYCNIRILHTYIVYNPFEDEEYPEAQSPAVEEVR